MKDVLTRRELLRHWMDELSPRLLQGNVRLYPFPEELAEGLFFNARRFVVRLDGARLTTILEIEDHVEVRAESELRSLWAHLSVGGQNMKPPRVPSWEELGWCKRYFLRDRKAIQVLPPKAEYVNDNPFVLHLYVPLEADPLPDFRHLTDGGVLGL